jgi:nitrite reductase/ring-hydroxylating ferredoxin subunit
MRREYAVAKAVDIPSGTHLVVEAGGKQIGIFNVGGEYYALPNTCFHQNGPLCRGITGGTLVASKESNWSPIWVHDGEIIICPWHSLEFNIKTGQCLAYPRRRLPSYDVRIEGEDVMLALDR